MRALILAAGRGTRLGADNTPKCLITLGESTLLDRYLDTLHELAVPVTLVVGHGADYIRQHVQQRANVPELVLNPRHSEGSIVSLSAGLHTMVPYQEDLLLLDGDVAFAPELLTRLMQSPAPNALLVDVGTSFTDEQYMAGISHGAAPTSRPQGNRETNHSEMAYPEPRHRVMALRRGPVDGYDSQGEWVGFARLDAKTVAQFQNAIEQQLARGQGSGGYEDALAGLLTSVPFAAVPTNGAPWVEIDFADDLTRARALFG